MKKMIVGLLIACMASACGWQLRGSVATHENLKSVYLSAENVHGELMRELKQALQTNKIPLAENSNATLNLFIREELQDRRTAAVGADALTSAYELTLTVNYDLLTAQSEPVSSLDTITATRTFDYIAEGASSGAREEAKLLSEMRREIAQQLIRRMNALSAKLTSSSTETPSSTSAAPSTIDPTTGQTATPVTTPADQATTPATAEQNGQAAP